MHCPTCQRVLSLTRQVFGDESWMPRHWSGVDSDHDIMTSDRDASPDVSVVNCRAGLKPIGWESIELPTVPFSATPICPTFSESENPKDGCKHCGWTEDAHDL